MKWKTQSENSQTNTQIETDDFHFNHCNCFVSCVDFYSEKKNEVKAEKWNEKPFAFIVLKCIEVYTYWSKKKRFMKLNWKTAIRIIWVFFLSLVIISFFYFCFHFMLSSSYFVRMSFYRKWKTHLMRLKEK